METFISTVLEFGMILQDYGKMGVGIIGASALMWLVAMYFMTK